MQKNRTAKRSNWSIKQKNSENSQRLWVNSKKGNEQRGLKTNQDNALELKVINNQN